MKIAIVCYPTFVEGVVATELGLELAMSWPRNPFYNLQSAGTFGLNPNVHYHEVNVPGPCFINHAEFLAPVKQISRLLVKLHKIELLYVHYKIPHAYAGYMAKQMLKDEGIDIPMVTTLHTVPILLWLEIIQFIKRQ
jgi:hypothetical protein